MKTDKNSLSRAIGDIDDRFVTEVLDEDAKGISLKKKRKPAVKYMMYYIPAAAGLLIAIVCIRSFVLTGRFGESATAPTSGSSSNSHADVAESYEEADRIDIEDIFQFDNAAGEAVAPSEPNAGMDYSYAMDSDATSLGVNQEAEASSDTPSVSMANPFIECKDLDEAAAVAGFEFDIPEELMSEYETYINAIDGSMIQVIFYSSGDEAFRIRKGYGDDISGDYNSYPVATAFDGKLYSGILKGEDDAHVSCAIWNDSDYAYSLTAGDKALDTDVASDIIAMLMRA
jgi:hypothetical protein